MNSILNELNDPNSHPNSHEFENELNMSENIPK